MNEDIKFNPTQCAWHAKDIEAVKHDLYGNGSEGLKVRFARVETKVKIMLAIEITLLAGMASLLFKTFIR